VLIPFLLAFLAVAPRAPAPPRAVELAVPKNDGWVTDLAGMLSPQQERELETLMESYKQGSTHEIALLTIPSLEGDDLERFALRVGRAWGIGGKEKNNGALLLVSKADHKIRIEVGRGLEGELNDALCGRIIRNVIAPEFKQGRFAAGLKAGIIAIHQAIGGDYGAIPDRVRDGFASVALVLLVVSFLVAMIFIRIASSGGGGGTYRRRSMLGPILWGLGGPRIGGGGFGGFGGGGGGGGSFGGFSGFGGGGGFSGGGASGSW
jgi:uncharacterized protein